MGAHGASTSSFTMNEEEFEMIGLSRQGLEILYKCGTIIMDAGKPPPLEIEEEDSCALDIKPALAELHGLADNYCTAFDAASFHDTIMTTLNKKYIDGDVDFNIENDISEYKEILKSKMSKHNSKRPHPLMKNFANIFATQTTSENLDTSDLQETEYIENFIDPITKSMIVNPVRNKHCNHLYDKSTISALLKRNNRLRCPAIGCNNRQILTLQDLVVDKEIQLKLSQAQSKNK